MLKDFESYYSGYKRGALEVLHAVKTRLCHECALGTPLNESGNHSAYGPCKARMILDMEERYKDREVKTWK